MIGALEDIEVEPSSSTLRARIAVDHIGIEKAAGIEQVLSGSTMDEVARLVRLQLKDRLPPIQIPVKVQQSIDLPAVTKGPVRIDGARMPLQAAVSQVLAGQGQLWIAVHFQPGDLVKTADAPEVGDASAAEAGVSLGVDDDTGRGQAAGQGQGEVTMRAHSAVAALAACSVLAASLACGREDRDRPPTSSAPRSRPSRRSASPSASGWTS